MDPRQESNVIILAPSPVFFAKSNSDMYAIDIQLYAINIHMNILAQLLSSQVRAEIFRLLFNGNKTAIHLRDLQRRSQLSIGTIQKEIGHLKNLDLVVPEKDGNRLYYTANTSHPLYKVITVLLKRHLVSLKNLK